MRSGIDWQRRIVGLAEALASAAVVLLWTFLIRDVDKASTVVAPACEPHAARVVPTSGNVEECSTTAAHEPPRPTPSGSGAAGGS